MKITKQLFTEALYTVLVEGLNSRIGNKPVTIEYMDKDVFLESAKANELIQLQIAMGIYKDFDNEFPTFSVVYKNQHPDTIFICMDIAKRVLKPFNKTQVMEYLKHIMAHEIAHLYQQELTDEFDYAWTRAVTKTKYDLPLANEDFAESIAYMACDMRIFQPVEDEIWSKLKHRIKRINRK